MNSKAKQFIKNFSYTFTANVVTFLISAVLVLIVPNQLGPEAYSYWQWYVFLTGYVGFFHLGWCDGMYLRYGGRDYGELERPVFVTQFWYLTFLEVLICIGMGVYGLVISPDSQSGLILALTGVCALLVIPRTFLAFILQFTNRIKEYSLIMLTERILYFVFVVGMLFTGTKNFWWLILCDLLAKVLALLLAVWKCREMVWGHWVAPRLGFAEAWQNISVGIKLLVANIASMLIVGIIRFAIKDYWGVTTFGKVSLTMSVSSLLMVLISAIGLILFPTLKRTDESKLAERYGMMRTVIMTMLLGMLLFYYPARVVLSAWLPKYADALIYMALLFPMCVFESKMTMLVNTYLKIMRKEKWILLLNIGAVATSLLTTALTVYVWHNLDMAVLSIVFLQAARCVFGEWILSRGMTIDVKKDIVLEIAMTAIFIGTSWFLRSWWCAVLYGGAYVLYLLIKRKDIVFMCGQVKGLLKK